MCGGPVWQDLRGQCLKVGTLDKLVDQVVPSEFVYVVHNGKRLEDQMSVESLLGRVEAGDVLRLVGRLPGGMDRSGPEWYTQGTDDPMGGPTPPSFPPRVRTQFSSEQVEAWTMVGKPLRPGLVAASGYTRPFVVCRRGCDWIYLSRTQGETPIKTCRGCGEEYDPEVVAWFAKLPAWRRRPDDYELIASTGVVQQTDEAWARACADHVARAARGGAGARQVSGAGDGGGNARSRSGRGRSPSTHRYHNKMGGMGGVMGGMSGSSSSGFATAPPTPPAVPS